VDAPKSILETEITLRTLSSGQMYKKPKKKPKNPKKPQKTQKTPKNPKNDQKNPLGWFLKTPGFFQPCLQAIKTTSVRGWRTAVIDITCSVSCHSLQAPALKRQNVYFRESFFFFNILRIFSKVSLI
jgi:hypothetical protein